MSELRCLRIAQILRERLSKIFLRELADRIGFVTITDIKVSPDLRNATVFYSVLGNEEDKKNTAISLEKARGFINSDIGKSLHIKFTPRITFKYDATPANASRVYDILNQIKEDQIGNSDTTPESSAADKGCSEKS